MGIIARGGAIEWEFDGDGVAPPPPPGPSSKVNQGAAAHGLGRIGLYGGFGVAAASGGASAITVGGLASGTTYGTSTFTGLTGSAIVGVGGLASQITYGQSTFTRVGDVIPWRPSTARTRGIEPASKRAPATDET